MLNKKKIIDFAIPELYLNMTVTDICHNFESKRYNERLCWADRHKNTVINSPEKDNHRSSLPSVTVNSGHSSIFCFFYIYQLLYSHRILFIQFSNIVPYCDRYTD